MTALAGSVHHRDVMRPSAGDARNPADQGGIVPQPRMAVDLTPCRGGHTVVHQLSDHGPPPVPICDGTIAEASISTKLDTARRTVHTQVRPWRCGRTLVVLPHRRTRVNEGGRRHRGTRRTELAPSGYRT